jgi:CRP-like cAMP-binding protein
LEIKKKDYYSILENLRREEYLKNLKFYHSINFYCDYSRNAIEKINLNSEEKRFILKEVLIKQNDILDYIYIVRNGSFFLNYKMKKNIVNE